MVVWYCFLVTRAAPLAALAVCLAAIAENWNFQQDEKKNQRKAKVFQLFWIKFCPGQNKYTLG